MKCSNDNGKEILAIESPLASDSEIPVVNHTKVLVDEDCASKSPRVSNGIKIWDHGSTCPSEALLKATHLNHNNHPYEFTHSEEVARSQEVVGDKVVEVELCDSVIQAKHVKDLTENYVSDFSGTGSRLCDENPAQSVDVPSPCNCAQTSPENTLGETNSECGGLISSDGPCSHGACCSKQQNSLMDNVFSLFADACSVSSPSLQRLWSNCSRVSSKRNCLKDDSVVEIVAYEDELQMPFIMDLITRDLSEPYSIYTYRYFIHNWPQLCFLAKSDEKYVGAIVCKLDMHKKGTRRGYIAMLAVDKEFRRKKIGSQLVLQAIEKMIEIGCDEVVLETEVTNQSALHLYEKLGFVRDKRLFRYYLNGVDAFRLKLWLSYPSPSALSFYG